MKQFELNQAYQALLHLESEQMPIRSAWQLCMLKKRLQPYYDCELECERKLMQKYGGNLDQKGNVVFSNEGRTQEESRQAASDFFKEIQELNAQEIKETIDPVSIVLRDLSDVRITPSDLSYLGELIKFSDQ